MSRKLTLLTFAAICAVLFGCKKDEIETNTEKLLGRWVATSTLEVNYEDDRETSRREDNQPKTTFVFAENGSGTAYLDDEVSDLQWVIAENHLTLKIDGQAYLFEIKSLSKTDLHLSMEDKSSNSQHTYREVLEFRLRKE
jgi:putative protein kinase ArgK-like GTPase of G3E family